MMTDPQQQKIISTFNATTIGTLVKDRLADSLYEVNTVSSTTHITKNKNKSGNGNFSSRLGSEDVLRESDSHNLLTMGLIGCLSDNVQQAMKSFSIRPRKQYITFAFPFMENLIRRFGEAPSMPEMGCGSERPHCLTPALLFDQCLEVVHGFQTFVTLAPCMNRNSLPIVLLTLYQRDTTEGLQRHFESLVRILLNNKTLLSVWKLPVLVVDLSSKLMDVIVETCANTVIDIQSENLQNTFPGKSPDDLFHLVKEKMIVPYLVSYREFLSTHVQEVMSQLTTTDPHYFHSLVSHLQSTSCTLVDFKKVELFLKSPNSELSIKEFWKIWGHEQISNKVFPVTSATRSFQKLGSLYYSSPLGGGLSSSTVPGSVSSGPLSHVPIKEGLQNIIKCLKSQDFAPMDSSEERLERINICYCNVCKFHGTGTGNTNVLSDNILSSDFLGSESAFRRPQPGSRFSTDFYPHLGNHSSYRGSLKSRALFPYPQMSLTTSPSAMVAAVNHNKLSSDISIRGASLSVSADPTASSYAAYYTTGASVVHPIPHYFAVESTGPRFGSSVSSLYYRSRVISPPAVFFSERNSH